MWESKKRLLGFSYDHIWSIYRWITSSFRVNQTLKISSSFDIYSCIIHDSQNVSKKVNQWSIHFLCILIIMDDVSIHVGWSWNFRSLIDIYRCCHPTIELIIIYFLIFSYNHHFLFKTLPIYIGQKKYFVKWRTKQ